MNTSDHLNEIEHAGLIRLAQIEPELEYLFRHALIQDAAYGMIVKGQRQDLHAAVGRVLEDLYPNRQNELASVLAHHFDQGADNERALHYLTMAGDQAASRYAHAEAILHYHRAIDLAGNSNADSDTLQTLYLRQGKAQELSGKHEDALTTYLGLELIARERGERALEMTALIAQATVYSIPTQQSNPMEALRLSEQAIQIAREIGDEPAEAKILWNMSLAHWRKMAMPEALRRAELSLEIARRLDLRDQMAYTLHDMGRYLSILGRIEEGMAAQQEAEDLWRELGNLTMLADSLSLKAGLLYEMEDYQRAFEASDVALTLSRQIGNWWGQAMSLQSQALYWHERGEIGRVLATARDAVLASDAAGFVLGSVVNRGRLAEVFDYLNQAERIPEIEQELFEILANQNDQMLQIAYVLMRATSALRQGDLGPGQAVLKESETWPQPQGPDKLALFDLYLTRIANRLGDHDSVLRITGEKSLEPDPKQPLVRMNIGFVACCKGLALMARGQLEEARATLVNALALFAHPELRFQRWEIHAALADLDDLEGNLDAAQSNRERACEELEYLTARIGNPEFEASFRARPEVAALLAICDK